MAIKDEDLHKQALERYQEARDHWATIYTDCQNDIDFALNIDGAQWEDGRDYEKDKVKLTINKCLAEVNDIVNEMRASRPSIKVAPADDKADPDTAEVFNGLVRNTESVSDASTAYDTAGWQAVTGGLGFLRASVDWIKGTFDQEPRIESVNDFATCLIDPLSTSLNGSDSRYAFVINERVGEEEFKELYPDAQPVDFTSMDSSWCNSETKTVRIAEYYYKTMETRTLYEVVLNGEYDIMLDTDQEKIEATLGYKLTELEKGAPVPMDGRVYITRSRKETVPLIKWCKLNGQEVLEKTDWLSEYIPVIPVYGNLIFNRGERIVFGLVRVLRDPQRLYNYWKSSHAEIVALQPKAPYIAAEGQITKENEKYWAQANKKNFPVLFYNPTELKGQLLPPPMRQPPPQPSLAMAQEALSASDDMKSVVGKIYDQGPHTLGAESGSAIMLKERKAQNNNYHYIDNQSKSICQIGRILVDLYPKLYDGKRVVRILGEDGTEKTVPINQPVKEPAFTPKAEKFRGIYDLNAGKYDVTVHVGPSFASRRQEGVAAALELMSIAPNLMGLALDIVARNIDAPFMDEVADRVKKGLPPGLADDKVTPEQVAMQQATQAIELLKARLVEMEKALNDKMRAEDQKFAIETEKLKLERSKIAIDAFEAEIKAFQAQSAAQERMQPQDFARVIDTIMNIQTQLDDTSNALGLLLDADAGPSQPPLQ